MFLQNVILKYHCIFQKFVQTKKQLMREETKTVTSNRKRQQVLDRFKPKKP